MENSVFCSELENVNEAAENKEKQLEEYRRWREALDEYVRQFGFKNVLRKQRKLRKTNKRMGKEIKCLKKENKRLSEENEVLKGRVFSEENERSKSQESIAKSAGEKDTASNGRPDQPVRSGNMVCLSEKKKKTFLAEVKNVFLKTLPKLFITVVKPIATALTGWFSGWLCKRVGGLCT